MKTITAEKIVDQAMLAYRTLATKFVRSTRDAEKHPVIVTLGLFNLVFYVVLMLVETPFFVLLNQLPGMDGPDLPVMFVFFNLDITFFLFLLNWFDKWQVNAPKKHFYQVIGGGAALKVLALVGFHFLLNPLAFHHNLLLLEFIFDTEGVVFFFYLYKFYQRVRHASRVV